MIKNCVSEDSGKAVSWDFQGSKIVKTYPYAVYFEVAKDNSAVVIVEPDNEFSPDNAVIYNADGSEKKRILNPTRDKGAICFGDIYYEKGDIVLISVCPCVHYACAIDNDGNILRVHETR